MTRLEQDPSYSLLKDQLIASTGLSFYADRDQLLTELINARLALLGLRHCRAYLRLLADAEKGAAEMELLVGQLTIGETYFFRDEGQFAAIRDIVIPDILKRNQYSKQLRIWSAGCAAGAEPYSLAILLRREFSERIREWQIHIYGSDLNRGSLSQAAEGKFRAWALRSTSDEMKRECFTHQGRTWTIHPEYKQWISFHHLNLIGSEFSTPVTEGGRFDLILCRNVMIYFAPKANRQLIAQFHQSLEDGGWLVVGAPEYNLENYTAFRTVNAPDAKLYQKMPAKPLPVLPVATPAPVEHSTQPAAPQPATLQYAAPREAAIQSAGSLPAGSQPDMEGLRQLADRGDWPEAAEYGRRLLALDRMNPAVHFYQALIFESLGEPGESERSLRQAIYLDRKFALAHYHLGLALQRDQRTRDAARCFGNVIKVLAATPDDAVLTAGSVVTVTALKELAKMHLENSPAEGKA